MRLQQRLSCKQKRHRAPPRVCEVLLQTVHKRQRRQALADSRPGRLFLLGSRPRRWRRGGRPSRAGQLTHWCWGPFQLLPLPAHLTSKSVGRSNPLCRLGLNGVLDGLSMSWKRWGARADLYWPSARQLRRGKRKHGAVMVYKLACVAGIHTCRGMLYCTARRGPVPPSLPNAGGASAQSRHPALKSPAASGAFPPLKLRNAAQQPVASLCRSAQLQLRHGVLFNSEARHMNG